MRLALDYFCNKCKKPQIDVIKDGGIFFCPGCDEQREGTMLPPSIVCLKVGREIFPGANIKSLRKAAKEGKIKVI